MFLKTVINQKLHGQDVVNVLCWSGSGATLANGQAFADALRDIYLDTVSVQLAPSWSLQSVTVYDADAAPGTPGIDFIPALGPIVGTHPSPALPTQTSALLAFTSIVGPPWRGRMFFAGVNIGQVQADGLWGSGIIDQMTNFGTRLLTFGADTGIIATHSIIGADKAVAPDPPTPIADRTAIISGYTPRPIPSTQRRRKIGVGS